MKKRKNIILFAVLAGMLVAVLSLVYWPKQLNGTMTVASGTGETAVIEWELSCYNSLLLPTFAKGTLTVDGVEYADRYTKLKDFHGESDDRLFPSGWWKSQNSTPYNLTFVRSDCADIVQASCNQIIVTNVVIDKNIQTISYAYFDDSNHIDEPDGSGHIPGIQFYGPAQNAEEAAEIAESFGYKTP